MKRYSVICAIGPDRVGFVDDVSEYLARRNLNIEESRAAVLGREFGFLMLVSGEEESVRSLIDEKDEFAREAGFYSLIIRETDEPESRQLPDALPYELEAASLDHPGIVQQITAVLHRFDVNIESMKTHVSPAPVSGTPLFSLIALVYVPTTVKVLSLRDELHAVGDRFNIDVTFHPQGAESR
jgi:glycine cleavage system regulatory protein